jgi:hypothetical protein
VPPSAESSALVIFVEVAFKSFQHICHVRKPGALKGQAGVNTAIARAANEHHWSVGGMADSFFDLADKVRIYLPVRAVVPGNEQGADRMADEQEFHFAAAIDEYRGRFFFEEFSGLLWRQVVHWSSIARDFCCHYSGKPVATFAGPPC